MEFQEKEIKKMAESITSLLNENGVLKQEIDGFNGSLGNDSLNKEKVIEL